MKYYLLNSGGTTTNTNGTGDTITATADLGNRPVNQAYVLGLQTGGSADTAELNLYSDGRFRSVYNGVPEFTFATPITLNRPFKRGILIQNGQLVYILNAEKHSRPYAGSVRITQAVDGIGWDSAPSPIRYSVTVSSFCHTKNFFQTCHLYNSTPDSTKRAGNATGSPVTMTTTEKGAGYTASSQRGSATGAVPAPVTQRPQQTQQPPPKQTPRQPQPQTPLPKTTPSIPPLAFSLSPTLILYGVGGVILFILITSMFKK